MAELVEESPRIGVGRIQPVPREEERMSWLAEFEIKWKSVRLLRPNHKLAIKQYYSLKQGHDGTVALCYFCKKQFSIHDMQIHHCDHDRTNNQLSNVPPACGACNNEDKARYMAAEYSHLYANRASVIALKRENTTESESIEKSEQARLLKQAPLTTQLKMRYKQEALAYLIEYVKDQKLFDVAVADVESITGCSHVKAIEYLDAYSVSGFAPFRQWLNENGQWIAPRQDSEAYKRAVEQVNVKQKVGEE